MKLENLKNLVMKLLMENEELRGDDDLLYLEVLKSICPHWNNAYINTDIENVTICEFFTQRRNRKLPSFESVRRSRQKVQEERPGLKPCAPVQKGRQMQENRFYDFAKLKQQSLF